MKVGILGGGQLACMLAEALGRLGAHPRVYDPDPDAPARGRVVDVVQAPFDDLHALREFAAGCDVITYEREDLPVDALRAATIDTPFLPELGVLEIAQDRILEKQFITRSGLPCVRHRIVGADERLDAACAAFGFPVIAKTTRGGYDGKGQFLLHDGAQASAAEQMVVGARWVLEERVDIAAEASCIVARSSSEEVTFPVVENLHRDHILDRSVVPCRLPPAVTTAIRELALETARAIHLRGLLAVEFFVANGGATGVAVGDHRILINELAPRPHNSGHVFARACTFGQFDALARLLVGAPLGTPRGYSGSFCMGNLLGDVWLAQARETSLDLTSWSSFEDVIDIHLYGKRRPAERRKMGHFVVRGASSNEALARTEEFRRALARPHALTPSTRNHDAG